MQAAETRAMVALQPLNYDRRDIAEGEGFLATAEHARMFKVWGKARYDDGAAAVSEAAGQVRADDREEGPPEVIAPRASEVTRDETPGERRNRLRRERQAGIVRTRAD